VRRCRAPSMVTMSSSRRKTKPGSAAITISLASVIDRESLADGGARISRAEARTSPRVADRGSSRDHMINGDRSVAYGVS
jgi:hypothetical protein